MTLASPSTCSHIGSCDWLSCCPGAAGRNRWGSFGRKGVLLYLFSDMRSLVVLSYAKEPGRTQPGMMSSDPGILFIHRTPWGTKEGYHSPRTSCRVEPTPALPAMTTLPTRHRGGSCQAAADSMLPGPKGPWAPNGCPSHSWRSWNPVTEWGFLFPGKNHRHEADTETSVHSGIIKGHHSFP